MYLIAGSTELEIRQLKENRDLQKNFDFLVTGVGIVESTLSLSRFLSSFKKGTNSTSPDGVILSGVCGAYSNAGVDILSICLAEEEHLGDFGVAINNELQYFTDDVLKNQRDFNLRNRLFNKMEERLTALQVSYRSGNFVTVNSCTGTLARGNFLRDKFNAICENMEGAALARVCELNGLPMAELRCVSNIVEDRAKSKWKIQEAVAKGSDVLAKILVGLDG